eukprot:CAMPEP_0119102442 /NCGR_PEP_ID=MMETSP1180-20130426/1189_1 /TAXON_ID=3052 ORGANISM="Chlamydomonas cf sp, Strain CCMP681" /NCGR_SAMPLE_ID=MMETSP1180 /ASSEMBLY_ACC=CAM_ASM_000741 /LENGTH=71 /DNA_ID=CAMNT_0007086735 /DNA_START=1192 /DNA_END=1407 /DNA_ORIENTATION=+
MLQHLLLPHHVGLVTANLWFCKTLQTGFDLELSHEMHASVSFVNKHRMTALLGIAADKTSEAREAGFKLKM